MKDKYLIVALVILIPVNVVLTYRNVKDWKDDHIADFTKMVEVLPSNKDKDLKDPVEVRQYVGAMASQKGVNVAMVDRIISCESKFNPNARNKTSTAKGLAQFIDGTWSNNCEGDVFNPQHNTRCFLDNFKSHESWWSQCL